MWNANYVGHSYVQKSMVIGNSACFDLKNCVDFRKHSRKHVEIYELIGR